ncbi:NAD-dependent succinate-semialdehyde dehydrogenase [Verminephrobacter eiseniae]|uniref:Succinate-semialdehyde dehydrogenase (NAD(P)(+)) n=1 Tax=Verminephrobacter eiseniae (strain EF01-2) TaxID=391735 RepID=A1WRG2_VEREI|nr:NAD-dependent succinate-semialdehyde dehydrogenase [Verminephrobacter eiseniae]ABM60219.1 Succinate-semialdehyde dehydrogenase (NAD(P)(+)) [Verminephrobacter eiseniae EF01-2]MCW5260449.1 NAD-dependent succinate-semialdehyde dehydrogenase [Verminephrobacter eiseniae]MCW5285707.1 NAD-dependent succinate-semialdehyde dehydrogenase [Verminephrobacter eiseniae]MCW5304007.1 NAD-dependent succinate-semialdehyde dehydrogenase [Verminephrobacter eiseniae]MCW8179725.1 NAD-dependent succinate-semialde
MHTYPELGLFIDGQWHLAQGRNTEPVMDPATGRVLGNLPHASKADLEHALQAAQRAFIQWRKVPASERANILRRAAALVHQRRDTIARTLTLEQGKLLTEARDEVDAAADIIEWSAEEARRIYGRVIPGRRQDITQMVVHEPAGPVAAFTPWNFPASTPSRKISSALAAGCTVILKASEETPATAVELVRAFADAGAPAGVIALVFGVPEQVSQRLIASPIIRKISFTGSIPVGKALTRLAADGLKRVTMELGGHGAALVFADADVLHAARTLAAGRFRNAGQVCIAPSRFFVHERVLDLFTAEFVRAAQATQVGDGLDATATMGPLASERRVQAMQAIVADALARGATLACGGRRIERPGCFFEPTVVLNPAPDCRLMQEEPFGPIAPIVPFSDLDEVLAHANALPYGLSAYVFSQNIGTAMAAARGLEAGMVAINSLSLALTETPFGGVKASGLGHEGGTEGVQAYTVKKFISLA